MLNLILKDYRAYWLFLAGSLLLVFFFTTFAVTLMLDDGGQVIVGVYVSLLVFLTVGASLLMTRLDDRFDIDATFVSLPVRRSHFVAARYVTTFVQVILGLGVSLLAIVVAPLLEGGADDPAFAVILNPITLTGIVLLLSILLSVSLPFYFALGFARGVTAATLMNLGILIIAVVWDMMVDPGQNFVSFDPSASMQVSADMLHKLSAVPGFVYSTALAIWILAVTVSITISVYFYKKRDL